MEEKMLNTILSEFKMLNTRLDNMDSNIQNKFEQVNEKFALIDARFNTLEELVISMQNDIGSLQKFISDILDRMSQFENRLNSLEKITLRMEYNFNDKISALFDAHSYYSDQYQKLEARIRQNEIKIENLSVSSC